MTAIGSRVSDGESILGGDGMRLLEERIRRDGIVRGEDVLKVDSFLNHQMDIELFEQMGQEFACR